MAEIKVEPKRAGLGWLWMLIVLAVLAGVVWYFMNNSATVTTSPADSTRTSSIQQPRADPEGFANG